MEYDSENSFNVLTNVYLESVKDKKLVIGYEMIAKDRLQNYQVELWDLVDKLLIYRHSSLFTQKTLEFFPREKIEDAIQHVEIEMQIYSPLCSHIFQYLNEDELRNSRK